MEGKVGRWSSWASWDFREEFGSWDFREEFGSWDFQEEFGSWIVCGNFKNWRNWVVFVNSESLGGYNTGSWRVLGCYSGKY